MDSDFINATFEALGGLAVALSALRCYQDKQVKGIHWGTVLFFTTWGYWNVYYYPSVKQTWSGMFAYGVAAVNTIWLGLLWRYKDAS